MKSKRKKKKKNREKKKKTKKKPMQDVFQKHEKGRGRQLRGGTNGFYEEKGSL